jgi:anti-anti-sigma factor
MPAALTTLTSTQLELLGGRTWIATAGGNFCEDAAARFATLVESALTDGCAELVLDLTKVQRLDSAGAIALCEIEIATTEAGAEVAVAARSPLVLATLRSAQLDLVWPVQPDRDGAIAAVLVAPVDGG